MAKVQLNISISNDIYEECKANNVAFSKVCEEALEKWLHDNQKIEDKIIIKKTDMERESYLKSLADEYVKSGLSLDFISGNKNKDYLFKLGFTINEVNYLIELIKVRSVGNW